jgi:lipid II:glycine glycyltransferase (peptidoglycan interpeptide bridge formation enzyme)
MAGFHLAAEVPLKLAALQVLLREARRQRWWMLQAAPELLDTESAMSGLKALGFKKLPIPEWASALIDLQLTEDELLDRLNRRWKRALRKSTDCGVIIVNEQLTEGRLENVLNSYKDLQKEKNFTGLSERMITRLYAAQSKGCSINLFVAKIKNEYHLLEDIGYRLSVKNGDTTLDLIISTNEKGRQTEAAAALYWHSILYAKNNACDWFDIGGLSEVTPKGIAEFKQGLNAKPYKLVGEWRKWL